MHLLVGKTRRAVNKQMRNWDKLQRHVLLWIPTCSWQLSRCTWGSKPCPEKVIDPKPNKEMKYNYLIMLSSLLSNQLFWALFLVIYSWEQFFEPSFERCNSFDHFLGTQTSALTLKSPFFEWIYSRERSFGHFLEGSQSTRTYLAEWTELSLRRTS